MWNLFIEQINILRNFAKFTGKHLCQSLFCNKVAGLEISQNSQENTCAKVSFLNFIKKETLAQVFSCEFREISKNIFSYRTPPVAASEQSNINNPGSKRDHFFRDLYRSSHISKISLKTHNLGQVFVDKFTKLSKIVFSMKRFTADFL